MYYLKYEIILEILMFIIINYMENNYYLLIDIVEDELLMINLCIFWNYW
jgi:hypothetical protein